MTVDETISLHVTVIGGARYPNDFTMFWRGIPIGRIKKVGARHWWWGCNVNDRPSLDDDSGNGIDLDDCKAKFLIAWTRIRAELTKEDIAKAYVIPQR
jgi:hypothetical protein